MQPTKSTMQGSHVIVHPQPGFDHSP
jgi:hypothetical protein